MEYAPRNGFGTALNIGCEICGATITVPEGEQIRCQNHTIIKPRYYVRTTHYADGTYNGKDEEKDKVWQYADIGFVGHMLDQFKYKSIDEIETEIRKYEKDYGDKPVSRENIEAALIILCKFELAQELQ